MDCNTSGFGFDTILHQGVGSIAFFYHTISPHHANLVAYERELIGPIGLIKVIHHWCPYLWTRPFIVRTNHYSLKYLLDQCLSMIPPHAWVSKLFGCQFTVEFKPGHQKTVAAVLSCRDEDPMMVHALSLPEFDLFYQFCHESSSLSKIVTKRSEIETSKAGKAWKIVDRIHANIVQILCVGHGAGPWYGSWGHPEDLQSVARFILHAAQQQCGCIVC
jgi:hypothetical protein